MKKLYLVLFFLAILAFSCSKDSSIDSFFGHDQFHNNEYCKVSGTLIKVFPGPDDTQALIDAFAQAKIIGKNANVKLMPGTFEIGWIEVTEFNGTLSGSGKGKTIVTNLPDLLPDALIAQNKLPGLITFIGGDVNVTDLTVQLTAMPWLSNTGPEMNMFLFSDYSADFMPVKKYIHVNIENIELTGLNLEDSPFTLSHNGAKFAPDQQRTVSETVSRSNIDASVSNSIFSYFTFGVYVWGCKNGTFTFGTEGGNIFTSNGRGIGVNENLGLNVKIWKNEFIVGPWGGDGVDLNTGEAALGLNVPLETLPVDPGTYEVRNNHFNVNNAVGFGIMDAWRMAHPDNPTWMKINLENNTFILSGTGAGIGDMYCCKNLLFSNNAIISKIPDIGDEWQLAWIWCENFWWDWDGVLPNNSSDGCKFINNHFLKNPVLFGFSGANNCLLLGDLSNIIVEDWGVNNQIIGKPNFGHGKEKFREYGQKRMERTLKMHNR